MIDLHTEDREGKGEYEWEKTAGQAKDIMTTDKGGCYMHSQSFNSLQGRLKGNKN